MIRMMANLAMKNSQMKMLLNHIDYCMSNRRKNACLVIKKYQIAMLLQEKYNLTKIVVDLREEVTLINSKVNGMTKLVCMLDCGYEILDEIFGV